MINISSALYQSGWTDLVFKNRNKAYGAYQLRAQSSAITVRALLLVIPAVVMLMAAPTIYRKFNPQQIEPLLKEVPVTFANPPVKMPVPEQKMDLPKPEPSAEKLKTVKLPSRIVVTELPGVEETPPTAEEVKDALIGQSTQAGAATTETATPVAATGNGSGTVPAEDNQVYDVSVLEKYPEFEGGMAAWAKFIQRNLRYPARAQEDGIQGKVFVSFVVEKDGSVTDVSILKGIGAGCDEEAMRVIRKSPVWKPGMQHHQAVRVRYTMPLSFMLSQ